ncbi:hypothetical protein MMC13_001123 [Lambiella insularis]|nr:hypothetical protein [Lambiella insularis]
MAVPEDLSYQVSVLAIVPLSAVYQTQPPALLQTGTESVDQPHHALDLALPATVQVHHPMNAASRRPVPPQKAVCYVKGTTPPPTSTKAPAPPTSTSSTPQPTGNLPGFDLSDAQSADFWTCAAKTYKKIIIRGYFQACGEGGAVDTNLLTSYKAARAAGITNIDSYAFFCTGTQPTGVACKSPATQISEYEDYITSNKLELGHLWFDVEPASGECNAFNLGGTANEALAKEFTAIMDKSTHKWGIYGNGNTWSPMFPSRSTDIGSNLPLWAVQVDDKPDVGTVTTFMGGWTKAFAKQYDNGVKECSGANPIDLDTFSS